MNYFVISKTISKLFARDFYVFRKRITGYGLNYLFIYPILSIITFGYIQPGIYFGPAQSNMSIVLLIGMFTVNMLALSFTLLSPFIYDLEDTRFIDYQLLLLPPRALLGQMLLFPVILTSSISLVFFPLARLLLPSYFISLNTSWFALLAMIICSSLFCVSYIMLALCIMPKSTYIRPFWIRCNWPLMVMGGFWIPWHMLKTYSPFLSAFSLLDPFTYVTDGIRSALIGTNLFIPYYVCIIALIIFSSIFIAMAAYFFKKKLDHI